MDFLRRLIDKMGHFFRNENGIFLSFYLLTISLFYVVKQLLIRLPQQGAPEVLVWVGGTILLLATVGVRMRELPRLMRVVFIALFALFAVYLAFPRTLPSDLGFSMLVGLRIQWGHWLLPVLLLLGFLRPALGVLALLFAIWERLTLSELYGVLLSQTEYFPVVEFAVFMLISAAALKAIKRFTYFSPLFITASRCTSTLEKMALCAVAAHMSNYFYSGVKKWGLGDTPLSWAMENQTQYLILAADAMGFLPLQAFPGLPEFLFKAFTDARVFSNLLMFGGQLAAVIAVLNVRWLLWITAFYDLTHILIFLVTGIFFYKWIVLNFAIVAGLIVMRHKVMPFAFKLQLMVIVVAAPLVFWVAKLGWWDSRAYNHERFYAVLKDGSEIEVPTNYWGSLSVNYAQARVTRGKEEGFFPTGTFGLLFGQRNMERANRCDYQFEPERSRRVLQKLVEAPDSNVINNVRLHHRYVLEHVDDAGHIAYDFYPHHIWSMPWLFNEFNALDKRRIKAYRYVVEATCLGSENGRFTPNVMTWSDYVISVE